MQSQLTWSTAGESDGEVHHDVSGFEVDNTERSMMRTGATGVFEAATVVALSPVQLRYGLDVFFWRGSCDLESCLPTFSLHFWLLAS
jgi:hypothetical protein